jgi:hypothetical protein
LEFTDGGAPAQVVKDDGDGSLYEDITGESIGPLGSKIYGGALAEPPLLPGNLSFTDGTQTITFDEIGTPYGDYDPLGANLVDFPTGVYIVTFLVTTTGAVTADYRHDLGGTGVNYETGDYAFILRLPAANDLAVTWDSRILTVSGGVDPLNCIMGLPNFFPNSGDEYLFCFDRRRYWKYSTLSSKFEPQLTYDLWTGEPYDFFRTTYAQDRMVITNGVDPLSYETGTGIHEVHTDWDKTSADPPDDPPTNGWPMTPPYSRDIDTAFLVFRIKNRLVLLRTKEGGIWRGQRARWTSVNPDLDEGLGTWDTNDFKDADTQEWIIGAEFHGEELIVWFERSVWKLVWKDDYRDPFKWVRISKLFGSVAPMSPVDTEDIVIAVSGTTMVKTDGDVAKIHGEQIHDTPADWNQETLQYSYGSRIVEQRAIWHTYVDKAQSYPENVLAYNYEDDAFSFYNVPFHCFGLYTQVGIVLWDDILPAWNLVHRPFDVKTLSAGFPMILAGSRDQRVFQVLTDQSDNGDVIQFRATTQRLNPYMATGRPMQRARLGFVDIVASANSAVELKIKFMADFSDAPYKTATFNLGTDTGEEKVVRRILVNRTARFHRITIEEISDVNFAIDALIPWFQPDGDMHPMDFPS